MYFVILFVQFVHASFFSSKYFGFFLEVNSCYFIFVAQEWECLPPNPMVFQKKEDAPLALGRLYGEAMAKFVKQ
jgi:hypothetical protein